MSNCNKSVKTFKFLVKNRDDSDHSCEPFSRKMLKLILSIGEPVVTMVTKVHSKVTKVHSKVTKVHSKLRLISTYSRLENFPELAPINCVMPI